jgi:hypothetical protein
MVGQALCGEGKFSEAEPLLLAGYQGLKQRRDSIPFAVEKQMRNALESLAKLCEATNRHEQADRWRKELDRRAGETGASAAPHDSFSPNLIKVDHLAVCIAYEEARALLNAPPVPHP